MKVQKTTIYLSPAIKKSLKRRIIDTDQSMSEYIDNALASTIAEDLEDIAAIKDRQDEPTETLDQFIKGLTADGRL